MAGFPLIDTIKSLTVYPFMFVVAGIHLIKHEKDKTKPYMYY